MSSPPVVAGRTQPTTSIPGVTMPAVQVQTINHQAAGLDLGCTNCSTTQIALKDAATTIANIPTWAKVLGALTFFAIVTSILAALAARRSRHS